MTQEEMEKEQRRHKQRMIIVKIIRCLYLFLLMPFLALYMILSLFGVVQ